MQKRRIKVFLSMFASFFIFAMISLSFFLQQKEAIDSSLKFAPLANGWVSHYAVLHMRSLTLVEKYKKTVEDDLLHGRYRPSSHLITSISYALSPILHERLVPGEKRQYRDLMTGDLVIMSTILLLCMVFSAIAFSYLIFRFTGSYLLLALPILFIPLHPALTENLAQFHVDSQEIQLIFFISMWAFSFYIAFLTKNLISRIIFSVSSLFFLILSFLAKETAIVLLPIICSIFLIVFFTRLLKKTTEQPRWPLFLAVTNMLISIACTLTIYVLVIKHKTKYGVGYNTENLKVLSSNFSTVWNVLGTFSINLNFCLSVIGVALLYLILNYRKKINDIDSSSHFLFLFFLLISGCAFSLIIVPWEVILNKYLLPAVVFINFATSYALIILSKSLPTRLSRIGSIIVFVGILLAYFSFFKAANREKIHYYELAGYGTSIINPLVDNIANLISESSADHGNVFVEYGTDTAWNAFVPWGKLQLQRKLNIERRVNLVNKNGDYLLNTYMPDEELTSYRFDEKQRTIYLTNGREELNQRRFQMIYKGYKKDEKAPDLLMFNVQSQEVLYKLTNKSFHYKPKSKLPEFILYLYVPIL